MGTKTATIVPGILGSPNILDAAVSTIDLHLGYAIAVIWEEIVDQMGAVKEEVYLPFSKIDIFGKGSAAISGIKIPIPIGFIVNVLGLKMNVTDVFLSPTIPNSKDWRIDQYATEDATYASVILDIAFIAIVIYLMGKIPMAKLARLVGKFKKKDDRLKQLERKLISKMDSVRDDIIKNAKANHNAEMQSMRDIQSSVDNNNALLQQLGKESEQAISNLGMDIENGFDDLGTQVSNLGDKISKEMKDDFENLENQLQMQATKFTDVANSNLKTFNKLVSKVAGEQAVKLVALAQGQQAISTLLSEIETRAADQAKQIQESTEYYNYHAKSGVSKQIQNTMNISDVEIANYLKLRMFLALN
jgi:ElaB/YqjD/DUF883 family membrane-anchored ribosome-binding protein